MDTFKILLKQEKAQKERKTDNKIKNHKYKIVTDTEDSSPTISIISLNINGLTMPIKKTDTVRVDLVEKLNQ